MKAPSTGGERGIVSGEMRGREHRDRALEHVAEKRRRGETFAAGAQHIGGADIAGADGADIRRRRPRA